MEAETRSVFLDTVAHRRAFDIPKISGDDGEGQEVVAIHAKENFKHKAHSKNKKFTIHGAATITILGVSLVFFVAIYFYLNSMSALNLYGAEVMGIEAGGKTPSELKELIAGKLKKYNLEITDSTKKYQANLNEIGIFYDTQKMSDQVFEFGREGNFFTNLPEVIRGYLSRYKLNLGFAELSFKNKEIKPIYRIDQAKISEYIMSLESKINIDAKDSEIKVQGSKVQITPAVFGKKLETARLREKIIKSAITMDTAPIIVKAETIQPGILDEKTKELAAQAEKISSKDVVLSYQEKKYSPSKSTVASWVTFSRDSEKSDWKLVIDQAKMYSYFKTIGNEINIWPENRKIRVENGSKETVLQEGKIGLVIDENVLSRSLSDSLQNKPSAILEIPMRDAPFKTETEYIVVANWDKYIDVNLSTQSMCAYLAGGVKVNCWAITSGATGKGYYTPVGTHLIRSKSGAGGAPGAYGGGVCMPNPPSKTPLCGINYVSYFTAQGHAIHEAWWRSPGASNDFGNLNYAWNGSHGCVNAPYSVAQFIFDWAPIGTPVIVHY